MSRERKEVVITGQTVAKFAFILTIIAVAVFIIVSLVRGMSFVEIATEHWWMWPGLIVVVLGLLFPESKKGETAKENEGKEFVITGHMVARFAFMLTIVAVIAFVIVMLARGTPVIELFTDTGNLGIWSGFVVCVLGLFLTGNKKAEAKK